MNRRPGGDYASRPLHFIWLLDCSGSMNVGGKIQALNSAMREAIPAMRQAAENNPEAQLFVRAITFSNGAAWHVAEPTLVEDFKWTDVQAGGQTDLGQALTLVTEALRVPPLSERSLPPFLVLVSDGRPTDDWEAALNVLLEQEWGKRAIRTAIAIGHDADLPCLKKFIAHADRGVLQADNPEDLVRLIRWASTSISGTPQGKPLPPPPESDVESGDQSIW